MTKTRNAWTSAELTQLRQKFPVLRTSAALVKAFPRHTIGSIRMTAYKLGLRRDHSGQRKWRKITETYVPTFSFGHLQRLQRAMEASQ